MLNLLDHKCKTHEFASKVLERCAVEFDSFPSLREIDTLIATMKEETLEKKSTKPEAWVSRRVPGIHPAIEAICDAFLENKGDEPYVKSLMRYVRFDEKQCWDIYEAWVNHELHPMLKDWKCEPLVGYLGRIFTKPAYEQPSADQGSLNLDLELSPAQIESYGSISPQVE